MGSWMVWVEGERRRRWRWRESGAVLGQVSTLASGVRMDPHELLDKVADMPVVVPQPQFVDKVFAIPVVLQKQISMKWTVQLTMQIPQLQSTDKVVLRVRVVQVPQMLVVEVVEIPQLQFTEKIVAIPGS